MARDASYQPGVYRTQGGDVLTVSTTAGRLNVESGGRVVFKSGSYLDLNSGATLSSSAGFSLEALTIVSTGTLTNAGTIANTGALANTGTITNSSDGQIRETVTAKSTAQTLENYGSSLIGSTNAGALAYKIKKPAAAGQHKYITIRKSTAGGLTIVSASAPDACNFMFSKAKITAKLALQGESLHLFAGSSTTWCIVGYSTAAATYTCT